ncbi:MAG: PAS domain S-box protein [Balneolaceae bacterium]|nr:PAS domain S-box protein [Balneolaceae bacterium]
MKSVVTFLEDITEEKEYQDKLEEEQKRMERAQNLARLGWWTYDVQEDKLIWSDVLYKILGIDKKRFEATFQAFLSMVHPDDRSKLEKVMSQAREVEQAFDYRLRITNREDEVIHTQCRAQSTFDQEGNLIQLSGVLQDITKRVKAKKELEKNKKLFENLFLQSPVAMALISNDKIVQKVNQSFVDLFGYTREEIVGENLLTHLLPESDQRKIDRLYKNALSGQKRYYEDVRVTKDGKKVNLFVGALPVKLNKEVIAAFGIYIDITQLKMTESQLKHSLEEKEILLSEIHHRVKNNLAIISGLLELEGMNWENKEVKSAFTESQLRIRSIAMIHEKLYQTDDFANLQFENYIGELVEIITDTLNRNNKQINTTIEADDINLNINQALPCALIINELVTNAIKHAFEGREQGNVKVLMKEYADTVNIQVKDDGKGLPEEKQDLFDNSLGLTLVKQLAKQLNTEIKTGNSDGASFELSFRKRSTSGAGSNYFI